MSQIMYTFFKFFLYELKYINDILNMRIHDYMIMPPLKGTTSLGRAVASSVQGGVSYANLLPTLLGAVSMQSTISILSQPRKLTRQNFFPTEIVPGSRWEDNILISTYIVGGTLTTTSVCNI